MTAVDKATEQAKKNLKFYDRLDNRTIFSDADFKYHDGNAQPQGFGHICFSVPDLAAAVSWFDENKVVYVKRPEQGKMRDVAFIKDPDGYWIEIVQANLLKALGQS